jgi:hypothetical protein
LCSYELNHRIYASHIYPVTAPNGSTAIIYGHDRGLRILWRGGRRPKAQPSPQPATRQWPNGSSKKDVIAIDDSDEEVQPQATESKQEQWEAEEDELDPDCPYPDMLQEVDVDLDAEVLRIAVPQLPTAPSQRSGKMLKAHGVIAVACADGTQRVISFALAPPAPSREDKYANTVRGGQVIFPANGPVCHALAAKIVPADVLDPNCETQATEFLLVTVASDVLRLYRFSIFDELTALEQDASTRVIPLPHPAVHVAFHPSSKSAQLLLSDVCGAVRLFSPYVSSGRSSSSGSGGPADAGGEKLGRWEMALHTSFAFTKNGLANRKRILDAKWILGGKAVLVLLEDGEWGVWDLSGSQPGRNAEEFTLRGYLGASATESPASTHPKKSSRLVPMTPNTRKTKAEVLFSGPPKTPGVAASGGITVASGSTRLGQQDESIIMWYNSQIYCIQSLQAFWQRSTNQNSNTFGSLHSPGLTHITDINLHNENITSISQFAPITSSSSIGQMNTQRDLLVSAEHRLIILQALRPAGPARMLFQRADASEVPKASALDQKMLDVGQLDLGGMDRMLESMAAGDARPRKVGFAH